jgi:hypothetical protein
MSCSSMISRNHYLILNDFSLYPQYIGMMSKRGTHFHTCVLVTLFHIAHTIYLSHLLVFLSRNHTTGLKPLNLLLRIPQSPQHLSSMLSQCRRRRSNPRRTFRKFDGRIDEFDGTTRRMINFFDHIPRKHYLCQFFCYSRLGERGCKPCSCLIVPAISLTAAYGIPLPSKTSNHSSVPFCLVIVVINSSSKSLFSTLLAFVTNFGSCFHSGMCSLSHNTPNNLSLPPPNMILPFLVSKPL